VFAIGTTNNEGDYDDEIAKTSQLSGIESETAKFPRQGTATDCSAGTAK